MRLSVAAKTHNDIVDDVVAVETAGEVAELGQELALALASAAQLSKVVECKSCPKAHARHWQFQREFDEISPPGGCKRTCL